MEEEVIIGGTKNIIRAPKEPNPKDLEHLYDVCNELFKDKPNCFYKSDEVAAMKKEGSKIFI